MARKTGFAVSRGAPALRTRSAGVVTIWDATASTSAGRPPGARRSTRFQRASASAAVAARLLEVYYDTDVRALLPAVLARTAVLHREGDEGTRFELGREVAALIPGATLVPLPGTSHLYYHGDWEGVLEATVSFLHEPADAGPRLTERELEVAELVAAGPTAPSPGACPWRRAPPRPTWRTSGASCRCARGPRSRPGSPSTGSALSRLGNPTDAGAANGGRGRGRSGNRPYFTRWPPRVGGP